MILHLDMDAFFASVEQMDNPQLRGKPVIVGGGERGVVATASYEARVFGVHSAMAMATARKLCPHAEFIRGNYHRYSQLSAIIMSSLYKFSPVVRKASIDEAYLNINGKDQNRDDLLRVALEIKKTVAAVSGGLTCSIGIAPVKFLAKMSSDVNKPDGVFILLPKDVDKFLCALDVKKLPGVGKSMTASLLAIGISRVAQLRSLSREFLSQRYGKFGQSLYEKAWGIDSRVVYENEPPKSESSENTFVEDVFDKRILARALFGHADKVGQTLRRKGLAGRTVIIKIKFSDFKQITRSRTMQRRTNSSHKIYEVACSLLAPVNLSKPARLIGVCVSGFEPRQEQLLLIDPDRDIENLNPEIADKFERPV